MWQDRCISIDFTIRPKLSSQSKHSLVSFKPTKTKSSTAWSWNDNFNVNVNFKLHTAEYSVACTEKNSCFWLKDFINLNITASESRELDGIITAGTNNAHQNNYAIKM